MTRCDVVLERCINHLRALYTLRVLNDWDVPTVNSYEVANICGDKLLTSTALERAGLPTPRTLIAFTPESGARRAPRSIAGTARSSSGPDSAPVSATRTGWNSAGSS